MLAEQINGLVSIYNGLRHERVKLFETPAALSFNTYNFNKKKEEEKSMEKYYVYSFSEHAQHYEIFWKINERNLTLKQLGGRGGRELGSDPDPPSPPPICRFSKNVSSKGRVKPCFFVTFNIIISHTFPENSIEISQVVQKIWTISLSILAIISYFHRFSSNFWIFWHFLVTKKLMTSAYNTWCQHFSHLTYFKLIV